MSAPSAQSQKLSWAPPPLHNPVTVEVTEEHHLLQLDPGQDYIIRMPPVPLTALGGLVISGGHHVVLIGGEIFRDSPPPDLPDSKGRGLYLHSITGTAHIEGLLIRGVEDFLKEGINLDMRHPQSMVQLQNLRIGTCHGSFKGNHADVLQTWAGPPTLRIDRLTGHCTYQGFFLLPNQLEPAEPLGLFDFRRINLVAGGFNLWYQEKPAVRLRIEDVWVKPMTDPKRWPDLTLWPQGSSETIWKGVRCGDPPDGAFVPEGVAGIGYESPGYVSDYVPPPPTVPAW